MGEKGDVIVSNENVASKAQGFWDGSGPSPTQLCESIKRLVHQSGVDLGALRIVLGVRRQDQMLASRYSQGAATKPNYTQEGFNKNVLRILENGATLPGHRWLYYDQVLEELTRQFGETAVFLFTAEALAINPSQVLDALGSFCNVDFRPALEHVEQEGKTRNVNKKSFAQDVWRLGDSSEGLRLTPDLKDRIVVHFRDSNDAFTRRTGYSFDQE